MNRRFFLCGLMAAPVAAAVPAVAAVSVVGVGRGAATLAEACMRADRDLMSVASPSVRLYAAGERTYREWCAALLKRNMLTKQTLGIIEKLAVNSDYIDICRDMEIYYEDKTFKIPHDLVLEKQTLLSELLTLTPDGAVDRFKAPSSKSFGRTEVSQDKVDRQSTPRAERPSPAPTVPALAAAIAEIKKPELVRRTMEEATARTAIAFNEMKAKLRSVVLLDLLLPDGKALRDATGAECAKAGGFFADVAKTLKPSQVVDRHLREGDLQNIKARFYQKNEAA